MYPLRKQLLIQEHLTSTGHRPETVAAPCPALRLITLSSLMGNLTLFGLILLFLLLGALRKVLVYEAFIEGAKEGFEVAKNLLPYLVAMLCTAGMLGEEETHRGHRVAGVVMIQRQRRHAGTSVAR